MKARLFIAAVAALVCSCTSFISDAFIELEEQRLLFPPAGDSIPIQFTAGAPWTAESSDVMWCRISPGKGEAGLTTMTITAFSNTSGDERCATVTISCGLAKKTIEVIQLEPNTISIDRNNVEMPAEGGQFQLTVRHNIGFAPSVAEDSQSWIFLTQDYLPESRATREDIVSFDVLPNDSGWPRKGSVYIHSEWGDDEVTVTQAGSNVFSLSQTTVEMPGQGGDFTVSVSGSVPYHISQMPDWVSETGVDGRTHTFTVAQNTSDSGREGAMIFCDEGGVCLPLIITQGTLPAWAKSNFRHQSLFMRFTATWCGWCPVMNKSVKKAQQLYPNKIQHLALHGTQSSLEFDGTANLMNKYKIGGYPTGIVDGRIKVENSTDTDAVGRSIVNAVKETENFYGTASGARIETSLMGTTLKVDATVYFKEAGDYLVSALVLEDNINTAQSDYIDGDHSSYTHDSVARLFLSKESGETCSRMSSYSTADFSWSATLDSKWKTSNLRVLVYVQSKYGNREKKRSENYGDYYIDNCFSVKAGKTLELETE